MASRVARHVARTALLVATAGILTPAGFRAPQGRLAVAAWAAHAACKHEGSFAANGSAELVEDRRISTRGALASFRDLLGVATG